MIKHIEHFIIGICIFVLIITSWMARQEIDYLRMSESRLQEQVAALTMRMDGLEENLFFGENEVQRLADRILDTCLTDSPRPLPKKGKK